MNRGIVAAVAGGLGVCFIGYCFYFDRKRRSDPDFKRKLIEKRLRLKELKASKDNVMYPDLSDEAAVQSFFMHEIQLGEQYIGAGDIENGVEHLANAVAVTAHKENLLNLLRSTLPESIFQLIIQKLPETSENILRAARLKTKNVHSMEQSCKIVEMTDTNLTVDECLD